MQLFIATGHLGQDPELRYLPAGDAVASFSLAISKRWTTPSGEKRESTIWVRVSVWRQLAENCSKFLHKGSKAMIQGELAPVSVFTKKDGTAAASYEVTAHSVEFLDNKPQDGENGAAPVSQQQAPAKQSVHDEDVPF